MKKQEMGNINDTYFDGYYKDIWRSIIPAELTPKEIDFMVSYFDLHPGNKVLDIMCGYGRHAIALAKKGMEVTAVDNLNDYINEIGETAKKENLKIKAIESDAVKYICKDTFDLAICMGNSLCFFEEKDILTLFKIIASCLKPGGNFLINIWTIAEIVFNNFTERSWRTVGNLKFLVESKYHIQPTRFELEHFILSPDGKTEFKKSIDYIYSIAELDSLLARNGLKMKEVYSIPGKKTFTLGEPRAYIVAEKIS